MTSAHKRGCNSQSVLGTSHLPQHPQAPKSHQLCALPVVSLHSTASLCLFPWGYLRGFRATPHPFSPSLSLFLDVPKGDPGSPFPRQKGTQSGREAQGLSLVTGCNTNTSHMYESRTKPAGAGGGLGWGGWTFLNAFIDMCACVYSCGRLLDMMRIFPSVTTWVELIGVMLSAMSQRKANTR